MTQIPILMKEELLSVHNMKNILRELEEDLLELIIVL